MAYIIKEEIKADSVKVGMLISKGQGLPIYEVKEVGEHIKISKIGDTMILGAPIEAFDKDIWHVAEKVEDEEKKELPIIIKRRPVNSSNLLTEGYDPASETLELEFKGGGVYRYFKVPAVIYERFMKADSKGTFVHNFVKNKYEYKKV